MSMVVLLAEVEFELTAPAAVAAPEETHGTTGTLRPVAKNGRGEPWIPPSSLAGSFRASLSAESQADLMGEEPPPGGDALADAPAGTGQASPVRFLGTDVQLPEDRSVGTRSRTAIDPHRGAAAATLLRTEEYLPAGTVVRCYLRVDDARHHEAVTQALLCWRPVIGGRRTTGYGTTRTIAVRTAVVDLNTPHGRRLWLTHGGPELLRAAGPLELDPVPPATEDNLLLPVTHWRIGDALHIGTGDVPPQQPAPIVQGENGPPLIPGSTWKGVLRSRTAYILRSLGIHACEGLEKCCGTCPVCLTFGWSGDESGARGRLRFPDTQISGAKVTARQHVAVDRFTGGASEGLLFQERVVEEGRVRLAVHVDGGVGDIPPVARAALHLALWDLHDGVLGLGGGTTRGYGTLRCTAPQQLAALCADARKVLAHAR